MGEAAYGQGMGLIGLIELIGWVMGEAAYGQGEKGEDWGRQRKWRLA